MALNKLKMNNNESVSLSVSPSLSLLVDKIFTESNSSKQSAIFQFHKVIQNNIDNEKNISYILHCLSSQISSTQNSIERRKQLQDRESEIYDDMIGQNSHVTGDILNLVKQIKSGTLDENYMSEDMQKTIMDLYNTANEKQIPYTNMRALQFIYHSTLAKNQNSIPMLLFGNGYMTHFYEMIFEMEVPAFLYNFGVIGFFLYFMPFLVIATYGAYIVIKNIKDVSVEFAMVVAGLWLAIIISFLSGYTFFNSSTMMIIIALSALLINGIKDIEDGKMKIYTRKDSI